MITTSPSRLTARHGRWRHNGEGEYNREVHDATTHRQLGRRISLDRFMTEDGSGRGA